MMMITMMMIMMMMLMMMDMIMTVMFANMTHLAGHALFAVCALPLVAGDVVDEVEVEADAGRVA